MISNQEIFGDLWRDNFLQAMSKVGRWALWHLGLKPYFQALLKQGLKSRIERGERDETLDQVMEYTGVVGVGLADMLASVNA